MVKSEYEGEQKQDQNDKKDDVDLNRGMSPRSDKDSLHWDAALADRRTGVLLSARREREKMHLDCQAVEKLKQLKKGQLFAELLQLFEKNVQRQLEVLESPSPDPAEAARAAHSIKSSAGNFGAGELIRLAERLELRAREGHVPKSPQIAELRVEFRHVLKLLKS